MVEALKRVESGPAPETNKMVGALKKGVITREAEA